MPDGDAVIPVANAIQDCFSIIVATQDWHPANHGSFAANHPGRKLYESIDLNGLPQILWPVHCVQNTRGAELTRGLNRDRVRKVFHKGVDVGIDSYSGFFDNGHRRSTGMGEWLTAQRVTEVYLCGLATDYCVKFSALDAVKLGFHTLVVEDACRGVNLQPDDARAALAQLTTEGVHVVQSTHLKHHE